MVDHVLRRLAFGASADDLAFYGADSPPSLVRALLDYERVPDDTDLRIGAAGYVGVRSREAFSPDTVITDARQRWLFRMVHSTRPLQEKMALFWHQYFATAYRKIAGSFNATQATRMLDAKPENVGGAYRGQIQLFRDLATGRFRDLLLEVARDPAMLVWLDGRSNTRTRPQENFSRELLELFTIGVGNFTEGDVLAGARVFTGWGLTLVGDRNDPNSYYRFTFNSGQHDTDAKSFSFPVYPGGGTTIAARSSAQGQQDGVDLIAALARHPATAERLALRLYRYFVNDVDEPDWGLVQRAAAAYLASDTSIRALLEHLLLSGAFLGDGSRFRRYASPVEFVVRALKETGWQGFALDTALTPLANMGQELYEPPNVGGWATGPRWFSTAAMLTRLNFAATLASNQRPALVALARPHAASPERLLQLLYARLHAGDVPADTHSALVDYLAAGGAWTGSESQLSTKVPGVVRLLLGGADYQFI